MNENGKVTWVSIDDLQLSGINPLSRSFIVGSDLLKSFEKHGFLPYHPILLSSDGMVGDGHRRLACAKLLGIEKVPVIHTGASVKELIGSNTGGRSFLTTDWDKVQYFGVEASPTASKYQAILRKYAGDDALDYVVGARKSSRISEYLRKLLIYIGKDGDVEYGFKTLRWMVENNMQRVVIDAIKDDTSPDIFIDAINNNRVLSRGKWRLSK